MENANFMQITGPYSCIRCDFKTDESESYHEQDLAMHAHLEAEHPGWQTDGGASILPHKLPKSDRERIADLEGRVTGLEQAQ